MAANLNLAGNRRIHWAFSHQPKEGETISGDAALVREMEGGCLLAVADGLGHGAEAALAAEKTMQVLRSAEHAKFIPLLRACHAALQLTRGAVLSLAWINYSDDTLTWQGVGNVSGMLLRAGISGESAREHLLCRGGTVGVSLPPPYAAITSLAPRDTLLLFTDGLDEHQVFQFSDTLMVPERAAAVLMRDCRRPNDDALVLVARYELGLQP
ncbi:MAG: SpoIIE family protein phosphatase [Terriglobales bacterium]